MITELWVYVLDWVRVKPITDYLSVTTNIDESQQQEQYFKQHFFASEENS
jgi:hypothetical protein